jgi:hypothetical protein
MGMESGKVLAVNSMARIEHVEIDSADLNQGFEKFAQHLKQNGLSWPQLLASAFTAGKTRIMMTCDSESLDTLLRTLERSKDLRKQRETLSSVSLTCFGGVSSDLPFKAIQILQHHGIIADIYVLSPHSVNLFVPVESREAAVKALHSLICYCFAQKITQLHNVCRSPGLTVRGHQLPPLSPAHRFGGRPLRPVSAFFKPRVRSQRTCSIMSFWSSRKSEIACSNGSRHRPDGSVPNRQN